MKFGMPVSHQAILFQRDRLPEPPYNAELKYAGDYELVCRLLDSGVAPDITDLPIVLFDLEGRSSQNKRAALQEEHEVRKKALGTQPLISNGIRYLKLLVWTISSRFPGTRSVWRRRI